MTRWATLLERLKCSDIDAENADSDQRPPGRGVGVVDREGVESNAHRPKSEVFGAEALPTIWAKAAAYADGIASTEYFTDGNKRTAWLAANIFLDANGYELPPITDIEAEMFINGVALDA